MEFIRWNTRYSVGVSLIDEQHKHLIGLINQLYDAMKARRGREVLEAVLSDVVEYTSYHFDTEERLFLEFGYPDCEHHLQIHTALSRKARDLKHRLHGDDNALTIDVMLFLSNWLNNHILEEDKKYGPFLSSRGAR